MMKTVLVFVACLALASAAKPAFKPLSNALCEMSSASVCLTTVNASCASTTSGSTVTQYGCSKAKGLYAVNDYFTGKCTCTAYTFTAPTVGTTCNAGETAANGLTCTTKNSVWANGDVQTYWFSDKLQGDTCTSNFDCSPTGTARQCYNGKCYGQLLRGQVCKNATTSLSSACSIGDYCRASYVVNDTNSYCMARLAEGADCSATADKIGCPSYQMCLAPDHYTTIGNVLTCQTPVWFTIAGGMKANASSECATGTWTNSTDMTCYSYDQQMAIYNSQNTGSSCSGFYSNTGCSQFGVCQCTNFGSSSSTACSFAYPTQASLLSQYNTAKAAAKLFYTNGCEAFTFAGSYPSIADANFASGITPDTSIASTDDIITPIANSQAYCTVRLGYYQATDSICGAFHNMGMSSITVVIGVIMATLLARW